MINISKNQWNSSESSELFTECCQWLHSYETKKKEAKSIMVKLFHEIESESNMISLDMLKEIVATGGVLLSKLKIERENYHSEMESIKISCKPVPPPIKVVKGY